MGKVIDPEILADRAQNLGMLNGFKLVFVSLDPPAPATPTQAFLDVEFYNNNQVANILNDITTSVKAPTDVFPISGGSRLKAGNQPGQVQVLQVTAGAGPNRLHLHVQPIGDYSTYTLSVKYNNIDPIFGQIDFKFRPGCFNLNCAPDFKLGVPLPQEPVIDYLAKDYDSFKHVLITAMMQRVPNWAPTSEADLDQVLIDLLAADADELSDFQDRVMSEAYLATARKRVSVARHARLMDYHIHEGNQASTWLAIKVSLNVTVSIGFGVWTGQNWKDPDSVIYMSNAAQACSTLLNELSLYSWDGLVTALDAGSTEADLNLPAPLNPLVQEDANILRDLLRSGSFKYLLVQEHLNPETGTINGRDAMARQLLQLLPGNAAAESVKDPLSGKWMVRVHWREADRLQRRYCFLTQCTGQPLLEKVSLFHGNLITIAHGRPHATVFKAPGSILNGPDNSQFIRTDEKYYEIPSSVLPGSRWGTTCTLPHSPVSYLNTLPGGEVPTRSTLKVTISGFAQPWIEQSDLIESEGDDEHFIVETDEYLTSRVRFGNNINGRTISANAVVTCAYQVGQGEGCNIGADKLISFDKVANPAVSEVWNPFDVTNGREPEKIEVINRRVPEAYRARQLRAVTLQDYIKRAEELPQVSHAAARYAWAGSWRTVRIAIDPVSTVTYDDNLRQLIENYLDAVRLIGEDLEIREANYVPLDIKMRLCAHPQYWPSDLDAVLQMEFSDGYTPDGRPGFFNPDLWTFGQPLYPSQLIGRALSVVGVERVLSVSIRRWHALFGPSSLTITLDPETIPDSIIEKLEVDSFEIIQVKNDPDHLETGRIIFKIDGGRK